MNRCCGCGRDVALQENVQYPYCDRCEYERKNSKPILYSILHVPTQYQRGAYTDEQGRSIGNLPNVRSIEWYIESRGFKYLEARGSIAFYTNEKGHIFATNRHVGVVVEDDISIEDFPPKAYEVFEVNDE